jgi:hypothetical protein
MAENAFMEYLISGGFPEAQGLKQADRIPLLQGYVDTVILRRWGLDGVSPDNRALALIRGVAGSGLAFQ